MSADLRQSVMFNSCKKKKIRYCERYYENQKKNRLRIQAPRDSRVANFALDSTKVIMKSS